MGTNRNLTDTDDEGSATKHSNEGSNKRQKGNTKRPANDIGGSNKEKNGPKLIAESLVINETTTNDIRKILGSPSTQSKFDNDVWIYIERKQTQSKLKNLGKMKIFKNDVLVLELNSYGILKKKDFYNKDDMKKLKIATNKTEQALSKNKFIYEFFSSMRQKINDPLGQRAKKRKEINQR